MSQLHEPTFSVPNINLSVVMQIGRVNSPHDVILNATSLPDKVRVGQKQVYNKIYTSF